MRFVRSAFVASMLSATLGGCAASAHDLVAAGQLRSAWERRPQEPWARSEVVAAIFRDEAPTLEVTAVRDEALTELLGALNAQQIGRAWVLLRAVVKTRGRAFPYPTFEIALGHSDGPLAYEIPTLGVSREMLARVTGEGAPDGSLSTRYSGELCPGAVACSVLGPLVPSLFHRETTWNGPGDDDWRVHAPRAFRLSKVLADHCTRNTCERSFFARRPLHEGEPFELRAAIRLDGTSTNAADTVAVVVEAHLVEGPRLVDRFPVRIDASGAGDPVHVDVELAKPHAESFCRAWEPIDAVAGKGLCLVDLVSANTPARPRDLPARPPELGTRQESDARRPSWANDLGGKFEVLPPASQARGVDTELVVCHLLGWPDHAFWRLGDRKSGWRPFPRLSGTLYFPLVHLPEGGSIPLELGEQTKDEPLVARDTMALEHAGARIRNAKLHRQAGYNPSFSDLECVPWDREAVEVELGRRWRVADAKLDVADEASLGAQASPKPARYYRELGVDLKSLDEARIAVGACAELVGWADPRVAPLVDRADAISARLASVVKSAE